jgi:hypothetical protein
MRWNKLANNEQCRRAVARGAKRGRLQWGRRPGDRVRSTDGSDYVSLDEFMEAQRVRISTSLRTERFDRIMEERNDHMLLAAVLHETDVEVRR